MQQSNHCTLSHVIVHKAMVCINCWQKKNDGKNVHHLPNSTNLTIKNNLCVGSSAGWGCQFQSDSAFTACHQLSLIFPTSLFRKIISNIIWIINNNLHFRQLILKHEWKTFQLHRENNKITIFISYQWLIYDLDDDNREPLWKEEKQS